jgi:large subunit ribosomal protein L18
MIDMLKKKRQRFIKAKKRSKNSLHPTPEKPRLVVYRSRSYLYAQLMDDINGKVICSISSISKELKEKKLGKNMKSATILGQEIGNKLKSMKIDSICFDRNGFKYHGKIKALADGCREAGIKF